VYASGIRAEVRLLNEAIALLDQLVVVDADHLRCVTRATQLVRAQKFESDSGLVTGEEQRTSLINVNDAFSFDAVCASDMHSQPAILTQ
jgi:hypothetical protein